MDFDFGTIVFMLAFLWFIISEVRPKAKRPGQQQKRTPARRTPEPMPYGPRGYTGELEERRKREERQEAVRRALEGAGPPVVVSMETEPDRGRREPLDYDDLAEAAVRSRIAAAAARDQALNAADHAAFDRRIRATSPAASAPRRRSGLRTAIIWREVLGPPRSLRDD